MKRLLLLVLLALYVAGDAGRALAGFGTWTGNLAPVNAAAVVFSMTGVAAGGGSSTAIGSGLPTEPQVVACLSPCSGDNHTVRIPTLSASSTGFVAAVPPLPVGLYDVQISASSGLIATAQQVLNVVSSFDCLGVFSTHVEAYYKTSAGVTCVGVACANGGAVDGWADQSSHGRNLIASGSARPTYLASSSIAPPGFTYPGVSFDGVANLMSAVVNASASTDLTLFLVARELATNTNKPFVTWAQDNTSTAHSWALGTGGTTPALYSTGVSATTTLASTGGVGFQMWGGAHGTSGSYAATDAIDNGTPGTGTSVQTWGGTPTTGTLYLGGGHVSGSLRFSNIEVVEACLVSGINPSSANYLSYAQYQNLTYLNYAPSYLHTYPTCSTSSGLRIRGSGATNTQYVPGVSVSFDPALGEPAHTATVVNANVIDVPMNGGPYTPGTYDVTITNPDGGSITRTNGVTIAASRTSSPSAVVCDNSLSSWYEIGNFPDGSPAYSYNGLAVSSLSDRALLGNDEIQATGAAQPACSNNGTSCVGDADFLGAVSWNCNGTSSLLSTAGNFLYGTGTIAAEDSISVLKIDVSNPSGYLALHMQQEQGMTTISGKPNTRWGGAAANTYGTAEGGATHEVFSEIIFGTSVNRAINVDNSGSPVSTSTPSPVTDVGVFHLCAGASASYGKAKQALVWTTKRALNSTEQGYARTLGQSYGSP